MRLITEKAGALRRPCDIRAAIGRLGLRRSRTCLAIGRRAVRSPRAPRRLRRVPVGRLAFIWRVARGAKCSRKVKVRSAPDRPSKSPRVHSPMAAPPALARVLQEPRTCTARRHVPRRTTPPARRAASRGLSTRRVRQGCIQLPCCIAARCCTAQTTGGRLRARSNISHESMM